MNNRFALAAAVMAFMTSPLFAQFDFEFESTTNGTTIDYVLNGSFIVPSGFGTTGINFDSTGASPISSSLGVINSITGSPVVENVTQSTSTSISGIQFLDFNGRIRLFVDGTFIAAANDVIAFNGIGTFDLPSGDFSNFLIGVHDYEVSFPTLSPAPVGTVEFADAIPEPTSALLVGAAGMLVLARRKRSRA